MLVAFNTHEVEYSSTEILSYFRQKHTRRVSWVKYISNCDWRKTDFFPIFLETFGFDSNYYLFNNFIRGHPYFGYF